MARPGTVILLVLCLAFMGLPGICASIAQVQAGPQWIQVSVTGVVTLVEPGECYLQDINRSAGIRAIGDTTGIAVGHTATAIGTFTVIDGEAAILDATITATGTSADPVPLSMKNADITGRSKWSALSVCDFTPDTGWRPAAGLTNTGLLVKTWGTVEAAYSSATTGAKWFYINDGSNSISDYGDIGILVYSDADVHPGQFVCVTGISSAEPSLDSPDRLVRVIRTRTVDDVQVLREPENVYRFSDEFDESKLDSR